MKGYGPTDPLESPRFAGISTFLRLPHVDATSRASTWPSSGLPFDTGATFRAGARFGPKAIREGSLALRPNYNPAQRVAVFERLSAIDYGDAPVVPGFTDRSMERMTATLRAAARGRRRADRASAATTSCCSPSCGPRRSRARSARPRPLRRPPATPGTSTSARSTPTARSCGARVEEGLIDPARSTQMGMRGGLYGPGDYDESREMGFTLLPWEELAQFGTGAVEAAVERATGKAFLTFDIDFVDPAFAPGTGTPECGGPSSMQALGAAARLPRARPRRRRRGRGAAGPRHLAPDGDAGGDGRPTRSSAWWRARGERRAGDVPAAPAPPTPARARRAPCASPACSSTPRPTRRPTWPRPSASCARPRRRAPVSSRCPRRGPTRAAAPASSRAPSRSTGRATPCSPASPPSTACSSSPARTTSRRPRPDRVSNTSVALRSGRVGHRRLPQDPPLRRRLRGRRRTGSRATWLPATRSSPPEIDADGAGQA